MNSKKMRLSADEIENRWAEKMQAAYYPNSYLTLPCIPPLLLFFSFLARFDWLHFLLALLPSLIYALFSVICYLRSRAWSISYESRKAAKRRGLVLLTIAHLGLFDLLMSFSCYHGAIQAASFEEWFFAPFVATIPLVAVVAAVITFTQFERLMRFYFPFLYSLSDLNPTQQRFLERLPHYIIGVSLATGCTWLTLRLLLGLEMSLLVLYGAVVCTLGCGVMLLPSYLLFYQFAVVFKTDI